MSLFDLFDIRSVPKSSSTLRWDGESGRLVDGEVGIERFASQPNPVPAEISAAGLTTSDLSQ
jgi:hypothetical protein